MKYRDEYNKAWTKQIEKNNFDKQTERTIIVGMAFGWLACEEFLLSRSCSNCKHSGNECINCGESIGDNKWEPK